jgi:2-(3-amino-3-carboxypropyl)histidine synthase
MKNKTIDEISEKYELELEKIISEIKKIKAKLVLLQFPDGLKPYATIIVDYLSEKTRSQASRSSAKMPNETKTEFLIWFGSCYGACDVPILGKEFENKIDLVVQFGHNEVMPKY